MFDFVPKVLIIYLDGAGTISPSFGIEGHYLWTEGGQGKCEITFGLTTTWYSINFSAWAASANSQLNRGGTTYCYIAIG